MEWYNPWPTWEPATSEAESIWAGLGAGDPNSNTDELVQDGYKQAQYWYAGTLDQQEVAWYEIYPQEHEVDLDGFSAYYGEELTNFVAYDAASGWAEFEMCGDVDAGCVWAEQQVEGSVGNQAEWIVERPTHTTLGSTRYPSLPQTAPIWIRYPQAYQSDGVTGGDAVGLNPSAWKMLNCGDNTLMAAPDTLTADGFHVTWHNRGTSDDPDSPACGF
ncbi:G1 family glutamic endopeptidase [Luteimicrobium sp. DT211]|uniref:G1 family glutamic endopeptidase n=1 Tax=Luteimicrobium sp. DT211 TaxID=3393412 RepID=UPI003CF390AD